MKELKIADCEYSLISPRGFNCGFSFSSILELKGYALKLGWSINDN